MSVRSGFWNSVGTDIRTYYNNDFSHLIGLLVKDGVNENYGQYLTVVAGEGMQAVVRQGECWFNETWVRNDSDLQIDVDTAPVVAGYKRLDAIAVKIDASQAVRLGTIEYVAGTAGSTEPSLPSMVNTDEIHWHLLATILVEANDEAVLTSKITNYVGTDTTPFITGVLETASAELLVEQWTSELSEWTDTQKVAFIRWAESIRDILDEETAGHLQLEIDELKAGTGLCYDSYEDAVDDMINIPEGAFVYTPEPDPSMDDIIQSMTALHLAGSQVGSGTKNFTFNTEAYKRMLIITKKSGVIVESKEVPTDVLENGDVTLLGNAVPVIGTDKTSIGYTIDHNLVDKKLGFFRYPSSGNGKSAMQTDDGTTQTDSTIIGLAADLAQTTGASLTYNGNNSFTISVTDSSLSVYVYVDMLVLGGSASGRNVSVNLAGTDLVSTDAEGAILEVYEKVRKVGMRPVDTTRRIMLATPNASYTADVDCVVAGDYRSQNNENNMILYVDDVDVFAFWDGASGNFGMRGAYYPIAKGQTVKFTGTAQISTGTLGLYHYVE